ncbi:MAG: hypothetical protein ACD_54C00122G0004 [uncultured bacterium]|nr:MAG: hypothetical protein ACD_54C00122G0004 [uncultured bacterium]
MREARQDGIGQAGVAQGSFDPLDPVGAGFADAVDDQAFLDQLPHRHARVEAAERVLKHDLHALAEGFHALAVEAFDAVAKEIDLARS